MFLKNKGNYKILKILLFLFFIISLLSFIISSKLDMQINQWFGQGMNIYGLKIIVWIYEELGMTQSYVFFFAFFAVIIETLNVYKKNNKIVFSFLIFYYIGWAMFWFSYNLWEIIRTPFIDDGFSPGISGWFLESYKIRQYILIGLFIIETIAFGFIFYYLRFKFNKRQDLFINQYWIDAIKACSIFIITSCIVYLMKPTFGRPYYYSVDFENIFYSNYMQEEWRNYYISKGHDIKSWGILLEDGSVKGVTYLDWWQINDFVGNLKDWFTPRGSGNPGWWNKDFPSGHMVSSFTMLYSGYFFFSEQKERKISKFKWLLLAIWFIHINMMQYTQIISRTHWLSDTSFSIMLCIVVYSFNGIMIDKIVWKFISKERQSHNLKVQATIINSKYLIQIFINDADRKWKIKNKIKVKKIEMDALKTKYELKYNIDDFKIIDKTK